MDLMGDYADVKRWDSVRYHLPLPGRMLRCELLTEEKSIYRVVWSLINIGECWDV